MTAFDTSPTTYNEDALVHHQDLHPQPDSPPAAPLPSPPQLSNHDDLCSLYRRELEEERNAAEIAANEAISMIVRLQVEKAALQMDLSHYQRLFATRSSYDQATIFQLQETISRQEADKQALARELIRHKHALIKDSEKISGKTDRVWSSPFLCFDDPVSVDKRFPSSDAVTTSYGESCCDGMIAEVHDLATLGNNDDAKTKHVISFSVTSPTGKQYYSQWNDHGLGDEAMNQETEYGQHCINTTCYSEVVENEDMMTERLQSDTDVHGCDDRYIRMLENISRNVYRHNSKKNPFSDNWNEAKTVLKGDLAICESQLRVLEDVRESMIQAISTMRTVERPEIMLVMPADLLEECTSFANLGSSILTSLNKLILCLKSLVQIVKEEKAPDTTMENHLPKAETGADEEMLGNHVTHSDNSVMTDVMDSGINKIAYLWSIGLQWMSNDRCRAETAFSGWDH